MPEDDVAKELFAIRFWLRVLYLLTAEQTGVTGDILTELIRGFKNQSPDQFKMPAGQDFDAMQMERMPAIERVGAEIRQTEQLRASATRPPEQA